MSNQIECLRFSGFITLESYLESVKTQLVVIKINKPNNNLSRNEMEALKELKNNSAIKLKKADKGTTAVIMNKSNKIQEAEVQLKIREHYKPLQAPMVKTTRTKVNQIIEKLHRGKHIDDITKIWLSQTFSPPGMELPCNGDWEFRSSTRLQKSTNLFRSDDRSSQVVTAQLKKYPLLWIHCYSLSHKNSNPT